METKESTQTAEANGPTHPSSRVEDIASSQPILEESVNSPRKGWRFWAIFPPLCLSQLLIALETSIPTASLPKISSDLDAGDNWVWIINAYLLTKSVTVLILSQNAWNEIRIHR